MMEEFTQAFFSNFPRLCASSFIKKIFPCLCLPGARISCTACPRLTVSLTTLFFWFVCLFDQTLAEQLNGEDTSNAVQQDLAANYGQYSNRN